MWHVFTFSASHLTVWPKYQTLYAFVWKATLSCLGSVCEKLTRHQANQRFPSLPCHLKLKDLIFQSCGQKKASMMWTINSKPVSSRRCLYCTRLSVMKPVDSKIVPTFSSFKKEEVEDPCHHLWSACYNPSVGPHADRQQGMVRGSEWKIFILQKIKKKSVKCERKWRMRDGGQRQTEMRGEWRVLAQWLLFWCRDWSHFWAFEQES